MFRKLLACFPTKILSVTFTFDAVSSENYQLPVPRNLTVPEACSARNKIAYVLTVMFE